MRLPESTYRIGVLIPPANFSCEMEYPHATPRRFSFHFNRLQRPQAAISAESLLAMRGSALSCAEGLRLAGVDVLAYACTSGSFLAGSGSHREISDQLTAALHVPAVTTSTAVLEALRHLGVRRLYVVTPYPEGVTKQTLAYLSAGGFEIPDWHSFDGPDSRGIAAVREADVVEVLVSAARRYRQQGGIDALLVSCTNLRTLGALAELEERCGMPVVSSNSATIWAAVRAVDAAAPLPALGKLGVTGVPA